MAANQGYGKLGNEKLSNSEQLILSSAEENTLLQDKFQGKQKKLNQAKAFAKRKLLKGNFSGYGSLFGYFYSQLRQNLLLFY